MNKENILKPDEFVVQQTEIIKSIVAEYYNINVSDLDGKSRKLAIVIPRHIAIYLCRKSGYKLLVVAASFNRHYNIVTRSCCVVRNLVDVNAVIAEHNIKNDLEALKKIIENKNEIRND